MKLKLIGAGPFCGLLAVLMTPHEIGESLSIAEAMEKLEKAEDVFGLGEGKKFFVLDTPETLEFDVYAPFVRLLRQHGWFVIGHGSSQKLSSLAPELNAYVAFHDAEDGENWLNYTCSGFVLISMKGGIPKFEKNTMDIPKYVVGSGDIHEFWAFIRNSPVVWAYQESLSVQEVLL